MNVSVIIPALNEAEALPSVLSDLHRVLPMVSYVHASRIIIADNGSTDGTAEVAQVHGARVVQAPRRGYGSACLAGIASMPPEIDVVVFMDGDHSDYAEDLPKLLEPLQQRVADLVLGERVSLGKPALTFQQRFGNALACALMKIIVGHRYHDLGPFRAIRRASLDSLRMEDPAFGWTIEMQIKAVQKNLRIREIPVRYRFRIGKSKISGTITGSIRAGWGILSTIAKYAKPRWNPSLFLLKPLFLGMSKHD
jgi:glycosyltransferase involved in cell wall biosynthesis